MTAIRGKDESAKPLISVIIPIYNLEQYLNRCLDSILEQSYTNLEIILINDGSTDNSGIIADAYAGKDERVISIHQQNAGAYVARIAGIKAATGDYIGFVDGDDYIDTDMYEFLLKNASEHNADISVCGCKEVFPNKVKYYYGTGKFVKYDKKQGLTEFLRNSFLTGLLNKIYRAHLFKDLEFKTNFRASMDALMNYYLYSKANISVFEDKAKYNYIRRSNSITTQKTNIHTLLDQYLVGEEILDQVTLMGFGGDIYEEALNMRWVRMLKVLIPRGHLDDECKVFRKDIRDKLRSSIGAMLVNRKIKCRYKISALGLLYFYPICCVMRFVYDRTLNRGRWKVQ